MHCTVNVYNRPFGSEFTILYSVLDIYRKPAGYMSEEEMFNRRIYRTGGMVPRYTGYVPRKC